MVILRVVVLLVLTRTHISQGICQGIIGTKAMV